MSCLAFTASAYSPSIPVLMLTYGVLGERKLNIECVLYLSECVLLSVNCVFLQAGSDLAWRTCPLSFASDTTSRKDEHWPQELLSAGQVISNSCMNRFS